MTNTKSKKELSKEELQKMVELFNKRGYSLTQLELLDKLKECYSAQKLALQLLKSTNDYVANNPFINQVEKDELELQIAAITHFASLIKEAA